MRIAIFVLVAASAAFAQISPLKGWTPGQGFGWVWGPNDEVGSLNAVANPGYVLKALQAVKTGKTYDLGVLCDANSYKWPGHSATSLVTFRSPELIKRDAASNPFAQHPRGLAWHSLALYVSDNLGTQIDGLGHITTGADNHWYNGFKEAQHGTNFGITKADADTIPPVILRGVLIDVAGWKGVDALPGNFAIGPAELQAALAKQKVTLEPGDAVLIRTGTLRYWGATGAGHAKLAAHDSAGLTLAGAKWLVEQKGVVFIGGDTSGVEVGVDPALPKNVSNAVHEYLLVEQGVHIGEFHNLEALAANRVYRFTYFATTNRLKGAVAGTAMRPIAIE
ncbi:MAG: cyclase family protein [Bryobacterales bacterium]|nr:cyclase family protein [Bryobacterales bacterium]